MEIHQAGDTVYIQLNTHQADGTPITWAGSPAVAVVKDGGTTTETDGVSLTVDAGTVTGRHIITIDTSQDATFFATGHKFSVIVTAGTVDSVSTVGVIVAEFELGEVPADVQAWNGGVVPTPAEAGAAMTLTEAYDAAKTAAPSAATVAGAVLDEALGDHDGWITLLLTAAGYTAPANSDISTLLSRLTAERAGCLDVAISSRLATSGYTAPQSAAQIQAAALLAIQAYDPPTDAEMVERFAALNIDQGSVSQAYTVYDTDGVTPLADVRVKVTTGEDGSGYVTTKYTNLMGQAVFMLDPGTYYLWRRKAGKVFNNPDVEVIPDE